MVKQLPKLTLVSRDDLADAGDSVTPASGLKHKAHRFELLGVEQFEPPERDRLYHLAGQLVPQSALVAAARGPFHWDLRAVVKRSGESEPSVIRFVGPAVSRSAALAARLRETLERVMTTPELTPSMQDWGVWDGQIWFRRPLFDQTLAHLLAEKQPLDDRRIFSILRGLVEELYRWHERGLIHGHLSSSNVYVDPLGRVALLDAGVGASLYQAGESFNQQHGSYAPELTHGQPLVSAADVYGLGVILRRMLVILARSYQFERNREQLESALSPLNELAAKLLDAQPGQRPTIAQARRLFLEATNGFEAAKSGTRVQTGSRGGRGVAAETPAAPPVPAAPSVMVTAEPAQREVDVWRENPARTFSQPQEVPPHTVPPNTVPPNAVPPNTVPPNTVPPQMVSPQMDPGVPAAGYAPYTNSPYPNVPYSSAPVYGAAAHVAPQLHPAQLGHAPAAALQPGQLQPAQYQTGPFPAGQTPPSPYQVPHYGAPGFQPQPYSPYHGAPPGVGMPPHGMIHPQALPPQGVPHGGAVPYGHQYPPHAQPPMYAPPPSGSFPAAPQKSSSSTGTFLAFLCAGAVLFALWYVRTHEVGLSGNREDTARVEDLRENWESHIPSRMLNVALAAIDREHPSELAESIIVSSAQKGDLAVPAVNTGLLKIAFNDQWEQRLTAEDRRVALALGLGGLLKDRLPKDLPSLDRLHPGVILAVAASVNRNVGKTMLSNIPASLLGNLPAPFGPAFRELVEHEPALSCGSEEVQRLARFGTRGVELEELVLFLKDDTPVRLRALAKIFSQDNARAKMTLDIILKSGNVPLAEPAIAWGKAFKLADWEELEVSERLLVLAGTAPAGAVSPEHLETLCAHPSPVIRSFALRQVPAAIRFQHKGAVEALHWLAERPEALSAEQTIQLLRLLTDPAKLETPVISKWLESNPPVDFVASLLLSTADEKTSTELDMSLAVYLKGKGWKPPIDQLRKLSRHPDKFTRLFAYNEIYMLDDHETAREFLRMVQPNETDEENQNQLRQMLVDLGG